VTSMRVQAVVLSLTMFGLLGACAHFFPQPTPYQPAVDTTDFWGGATAGYGYSEQEIEDNRYRVTFAGNDHTKADTVQNYLLYRAAELTLNHEYDYFTVVDRNFDRSTRYSGSTYESPGYVTKTKKGDYVSEPGFSSYSADPIDEYTASADIVMFKGEKPASDARAYDARSVLRNLDPTIAAAPGVMRRAPGQPESH
jgi:hypothetical protein